MTPPRLMRRPCGVSLRMRYSSTRRLTRVEKYPGGGSVNPTEAPLSRLRSLVRLLEDDLRERVTNPTTSVDRIRADYRHAVDAGRTSAEWATWLDDSLTQVAMAWVL